MQFIDDATTRAPMNLAFNQIRGTARFDKPVNPVAPAYLPLLYCSFAPKAQQP